MKLALILALFGAAVVYAEIQSAPLESSGTDLLEGVDSDLSLLNEEGKKEGSANKNKNEENGQHNEENGQNNQENGHHKEGNGEGGNK